MTQPFLFAAAQGPEAAGPAVQVGGRTFWDFLHGLASEPALLQSTLVLLGLVVLGLVGLRMARLAAEARSRARVEDFLLGVEQALAGEAKGAVARLERVLAEDPENHSARLLLGEARAALGEPGEAHKHHVHLHSAFGVRSRRNQLALARSLLDVQRPGDAVEVAEGAVALDPRDPDALQVLFQAQLAAGKALDAAHTGQRLLQLLPRGTRRAAVLGSTARSLALAGQIRLRANDLPGAQQLLTASRALAPDSAEAAQLDARVRTLEHGIEAALGILEAHDPGPPPASLPALATGSLPAASSAAAVPGTERPNAYRALAALRPRDVYQCARCGSTFASPVPVCAACGVPGAVAASEPSLLGELGDPGLVLDEVEENRAHVLRRIQAAREGDRDAMDDLVSMGPAAVDEVLLASVRGGSEGGDLVQVLQRMGPAVLPALFAAHTRLRDRGLVPGLFRAAAATQLLGRVAQGFGREALAHFEPLLDTADRDLRKVAVDYFLALADPDEFHKVLDRFPPVEVIHRLNAAPSELLRRFLARVRAGSFLAEGVLVDSSFQRDEDLVAALAQAQDQEALVQVLLRRGYDGDLVAAMLDRLDDDRIRGAIERCLDAFGTPVLDHLAAAFADLEREAVVRARVRERLVRAGAEVVGRICAQFGPKPSPVDGELEELLASLGAGAIPGLLAAYRDTSLLERFSLGLLSRYTPRRVGVIRALARAGEGAGQEALRALAAEEEDQNLRMRIAEAQHAAHAGGKS